MTCKYCNGKLAPLRSLTDGEFCSDEHRQAYQGLPQTGSQGYPIDEQRLATAFDSGVPPDPPKAPAPSIELPAAAQAPPMDCSNPPNPVEHVLSAGSETIEEPRLGPEPPAASTGTAAGGRKSVLSHSWQWLATAWKTAPSDLRAMALLLPLLVALAFALAAPGVHFHFSPGQSEAFRARARQAIAHQWHFAKERIANRAAIAITDDFRSGLDAWRGRSGLTNTWSFDANGFVQPGPLAILKPTEDLRDYTFEFLGEVEHKAVGCAFRARDLDNYYAVKFIEVNSGPVPSMRLIRYAVIKGKEGPHVEKPLPSWIRADMLNRFRVEVHGNDFTVLAQGEVVDFFSDQRLPSGGVGFFCSRGEKARLRWVEVSHQYDALGRLCALLAPVGLAGVDKD
jgi:hypothetical protein